MGGDRKTPGRHGEPDLDAITRRVTADLLARPLGGHLGLEA
jgi:hypothetical protein